MHKAIDSYDLAQAIINAGLGTRKSTVRAGSPGPIMDMIAAMGQNNVFRGLHTRMWDFGSIGGAAPTEIADYFTQTKDVGGTNFAEQNEANGIIKGQTGAGANDGISLGGPRIWRGDLSAFVIARLKADVVTNLGLDAIGWIDDVTDKTTSVVTATTPTVGAGLGDCAVLNINTGFASPTMRLISKNSAPTAAAAATLVLPPGNVATTFTPTADTYFTAMVALKAGATAATTLAHAAVFDNSDNLVGVTTQASALAGNVILRPWTAIIALSAANKQESIDYIFCCQNRV